jgi:KDO2-lipid IV(A) lauroyltransferase
MSGRAREAKRRIREVFPGMPEERVREIAWLSWRNMFFSGTEMLRMPTADLSWLSAITECREMIDTLRDQVQTGRGGVIACPHMGSWELAAATCRLHGLPVFSIAAKQRNPLIDRHINLLRTSPGIPTVARGAGTMRKVLTRLRNGELLAILPDVRVRQPGVSVPFLNSEANVGPGMALFARHANVPVFPCIVTRQGWSRHTISIEQSVFPDNDVEKKEDVKRITALVLSIMDKAIREQPEQWFWYNKRWVLEPLSENSSNLVYS